MWYITWISRDLVGYCTVATDITSASRQFMVSSILHHRSQEKQSFIKYDLNKNGTLDFQVAKSDFPLLQPAALAMG